MYGEKKGDKNKVRSINIDVLDDGTYTYSVRSDNECKRYSAQSTKDLLAAIEDDTTSPHMKKDKMGKVMHEYKAGKLKRSSGRKVYNRKQAVAIGLSEAKKDLLS